MLSDGCSTSKSKKIATGATGTNGSDACAENAIPGQKSSSIPTCSAHRDARLEHARSERDNDLPNYASTQQRS